MEAFILGCGVVLGWVLREITSKRIETIIENTKEHITPSKISFAEPTEKLEAIQKAKSFDDIYKETI